MDDKITQEPIEGQSVLPGFEAASQVEEEPHAQEVEEEQLAPIYDPVQPFYTQRDRDSITHLQYNVAAIQAEAHVYVDRANEATKKGEKELSKMLMKEWRKRITDADAFMQQEEQLRGEVEQRYIDSFAGAEDRATAIMDDVKKILDSITKKHYVRYQQGLTSHLGPALKGADSSKDPAIFQAIKDLAKTGPENCEVYLMSQTRVQTNALLFYGLDDGQMVTALKNHAYKLFEREALQKRRFEAQQRGALTNFGGRIASYSVKGMENLLNVPSIFAILSKPSNSNEEPKQIAPKLNGGQLELYTLGEENYPIQISSASIAFLGFLNQAALETPNTPGNSRISLYLPTVFRDLELDARLYSDKRPTKKESDTQGDPPSLQDLRLAKMLELLLPLKNLIGRTPDGNLYLIADFESYDKSIDTMYITAPYFFYLKNKYADNGDNGKVLNRMLRGNVVTEPNNEAVELANRIITGLLQRGTRTPDDKTYKAEPKATKKTKTITKPDGSKQTETVYFENAPSQPKTGKKTFTYEIKWSSLIADCPQLQQRLDDILAATKTGKGTWQTPKHFGVAQKEFRSHPTVFYNKKLSDTVKAAFKIIWKKSDVPKAYLNVKFSPVKPDGEPWDIIPPTKSTINGYLRITHEGQNPNFTLPM